MLECGEICIILLWSDLRTKTGIKLNLSMNPKTASEHMNSGTANNVLGKC